MHSAVVLKFTVTAVGFVIATDLVAVIYRLPQFQVLPLISSLVLQTREAADAGAAVSTVVATCDRGVGCIGPA